MSMTNRLAFVEHYLQNPDIYQMFKRFTEQAIAGGMRRLGAHMIIQRIRWYTEVESRGEAYKICNNHFPYYARLFMEEHPEYGPDEWEPPHGFFRTQVMEEERNAGCPTVSLLIEERLMKQPAPQSEWLFGEPGDDDGRADNRGKNPDAPARH